MPDARCQMPVARCQSFAGIKFIEKLKLCEAYPFFEKGGTVLELSCCYGKLTTGYKIIVKHSLSGTVGYSSLRSNDFTEGETLT